MLAKRISLCVTSIILGVLFLSSAAFAQVTITVMHRVDTRENEWLMEVVDLFEAQNPDIWVEIVTTPGNNAYTDRLTTMFAGGIAPDVFYGCNDKAGFILNGWTKDLTQLIQRDAAELELDDYYPGIFDSVTRDGKIYGIPSIAMGMGLYYNKLMFEEAGIPMLPAHDWDATTWTWEEFVDVAAKLSDIGPDGRFTQVGVSSVICPLDLYLQNDGTLFSEEALTTGVPSRVSLVNNEAIDAFTEIQYLYSSGYAAASSLSAVSTWSGFWEGKMAMDWTGLYKTRDYALATENGVMNFDWGLGAVPLLQNRLNRRFTDPWFMASTTKHPEEAWRFIKFITGQQAQELLAELVFFPTARRSGLAPYIEAVESVSAMNSNQAFLSVSGSINHSYTSYDEIIGGFSQIEARINQVLLPALNGQIALAGALQEAERQVNILIDEFASRWSK